VAPGGGGACEELGGRHKPEGLWNSTTRVWDFLVGSEPPRATRARDEATQRLASGWRTQHPIEETRHPQALYVSLDQEVSFTPLLVGWHRAIWVFR
jgi:hypothetical protein